jgi:hypothetical protein
MGLTFRHLDGPKHAGARDAGMSAYPNNQTTAKGGKTTDFDLKEA